MISEAQRDDNGGLREEQQARTSVGQDNIYDRGSIGVSEYMGAEYAEL